MFFFAYEEINDSYKKLKEQLFELIAQVRKHQLQANLEQSAPARFQELSFAGKTNSGKEATEKTMEAYLRLSRSSGQPKLTTYRATGVIPAPPASIETIKATNVLKDQIKSQVTALPRRSAKRAIEQVVLGAVLLQIYRHIPYFEEPVKRITCSWVVSGSSSQASTCREIKSQIHDLIEIRDISGEKTDFMKDSLEVLKHFPDEQILRIKRPSRPHVRYKIQLTDDSWVQAQGHLPLLFLNNLACIDFQPLGELPPEPSGKATGQMLISWLGVLSPQP